MKPLETVVALQRSLVAAKSTEDRLMGLPDWMTELHAEHTRARVEIEALTAVAEGAAKERRTTEQAIADQQEKLKHYQQQMSLVRNQREYGALLQEIDHAKAQIRTFEEQGLVALDKLEKAQAEVKARAEVFRSLDERYAAELARWESEKPALAAELERLRGQVAVYNEQLQPGVRAQFHRIFERLKGDALAPLKRAQRGTGSPSLWHCGSCNYQVRPQVAMEIRTSGPLVQCERCNRLLYPEEEA